MLRGLALVVVVVVVHGDDIIASPHSGARSYHPHSL